jgi:hypothetical protein
MDNTPDSPAKTPVGYTTQGGNFWTLITPEIWKVLHAVLQVTNEHRAATVLLHTMEFAAMRAQAGNSRWLYFDVVFELQFLQVKFMEAREI